MHDVVLPHGQHILADTMPSHPQLASACFQDLVVKGYEDVAQFKSAAAARAAGVEDQPAAASSTDAAKAEPAAESDEALPWNFVVPSVLCQILLLAWLSVACSVVWKANVHLCSE